jgi:hypothetical protein
MEVSVEIHALAVLFQEKTPLLIRYGQCGVKKSLALASTKPVAIPTETSRLHVSVQRIFNMHIFFSHGSCIPFRALDSYSVP